MESGSSVSKLQIDDSGGEVKYKPTGCFVSRGSGIVIFIIFVLSVVGVGLIVYYVPEKDCPELLFQTEEPIECDDGLPDPSPVIDPDDPSFPEFLGYLPSSLVPYHYEVMLRPYLDASDGDKLFHYDGYVIIFFTCFEATDEIVLHRNAKRVYNVTVIEIREEEAENEKFQVKDTSIDIEYDFFTIMLDNKELSIGHNYSIRMNYAGLLGIKDLSGFYISTYKADGIERHVALTDLESSDARKIFPCFDEPALKATFKSFVKRKPHRVALSNMERINSTEVVEDGETWIIDEFEPSIIMSTYLMAYVVSDFKHLEGVSQNGTTVRVWARADRIETARYALDVGIKQIDYFEGYFKSPFPIQKMDMVAVIDFWAGAMENYGCIIYQESTMLYSPEDDFPYQKQTVASIVAHELAHQWFGNLVTMEWWSHIWLNEGFASFEESLGMEIVDDTCCDDPNESFYYREQALKSDVFRAFSVDDSGDSHPLINEVEWNVEISSLFDTITYSKGSSILYMLEGFMGKQTLRNGLVNYLDKHQYNNVVTEDLWTALDRVYKGSHTIAEVMRTWTEQMGFPVVTVTRTPNMEELLVRQEHFLIDPTDKASIESKYNYKWYIPLTYTHQNELEYENLVYNWINPQEDEKTIKLSGINKDQWILANVNSVGYFRVNYDEENWKLLSNQLKENHKVLPIKNRASLVNDALNMAAAQKLDQNIAFEVIEYMKDEREHLPWFSLYDNLIYSRRMLGRTSAYGNFAKYINNLVTPIYEEYGWDFSNANQEKFLDYFNRYYSIQLACYYDNPDCIIQAKNIYVEWMRDPENYELVYSIDEDVFCTAIRHGDEEEWDFAWNQFIDQKTTANNFDLLYGLSCSNIPWLISRFLDYSLKYPEFADYIIGYTRQNSLVGFSLAWDFMVNNYEIIVNKIGQTRAENILFIFPYYLNTLFDLDQLNDFGVRYKEILDETTGANKFYRSQEIVKSNIKWMERNYINTDQWLREIINTTAEEKPFDGRLPRNLIPLHYSVQLRPFINAEEDNFLNFTGSACINVVCKIATNQLVLHVGWERLHNVKILAIENNNGNSLDVNEDSLEKDEFREFYKINTTGSNFEEENIYTINFTFSGILGDWNSNLRGFYVSNYEIYNETRYVAATHLEPTSARKIFPCFDEPDLKATFDIELDHKINNTALSNGREMIDTFYTDEYGDWVRTKFSRTVIMPTYLLAFVVTDFPYIEANTSNGQMFRVWAQEDRIEEARYSLEVAVEMLPVFEQYYSTPYPMPKMDMIALDDFRAGAMENWGLILYVNSRMLYKKGTDTPRVKQRVAEIVGHEIGHQWFGNWCTMKFWDDLWLNEGFASFVQYRGVEAVDDTCCTAPNDTFDIYGQFLKEENYVAYAEDIYGTSRPTITPVESPEEIALNFNRLVYNKGAALLRMIEGLLSEENFQKGIISYLHAHNYSNAVTSELWNALSEVSGIENFSAIMDTFTLQMGLPVVTITRINNTNSFNINQKHFLVIPEDEPSDDFNNLGYMWYIPLSFSSKTNYSVGQFTMTLLNSSSSMVNIPGLADDEWAIFNIDAYGYYIVNYDADNWMMLIEQMHENHKIFSPENRAALLVDSLYLSQGHQLEQVTALKITEYLINETEHVPWNTARDGLEYTRKMLSRTSLSSDFAAYMRSLINPLFDQVGKREKLLNGTHMDFYNGVLSIEVACAYRNLDCELQARSWFEEYMNNPNSPPVIDELDEDIYCAAIRSGNESFWEFAWSRYTDDSETVDDYELRYGMGCTENSWLIKRYLEYTLKGQKSEEVADDQIYYISHNSVLGFHMTWNFVLNNFANFYKLLGTNAYDLVWNFSDMIVTDYELQQLSNFAENHPNMTESAIDGYNRALITARANIDWTQKNFNSIEEWLKK